MLREVCYRFPIGHGATPYPICFVTASQLLGPSRSVPTVLERAGANALFANCMQLMLKRQLKYAGMPSILSPHSFRILVVTNLCSEDVPLEDVQYLADHANPRITQIYVRRRHRAARNIVERISM